MLGGSAAFSLPIQRSPAGPISFFHTGTRRFTSSIP